MTEAVPDGIGPDGTVRLRCYLPSADSVWLSAGCDHVAPTGIWAAIRLMGLKATVRQLVQRRRQMVQRVDDQAGRLPCPPCTF